MYSGATRLVKDDDTMTQDEQSLEERMRPEERELYEKMKRRVGKEYPPALGHNMFYPKGVEDPVQWSDIKRWATINGDLNPLWMDADYARQTRWEGIVAPPLYLLALEDPVAVGEELVMDIYNEDSTVNRQKYPSFRGSMMANAEFEFFQPVRPGDKIDVMRKCTDVHWRQGGRFRLLFVLGESRFSNQRQEKVAIARGGAVYMFK